MSKRVNNKTGASRRSYTYGHPTKRRAGLKGERYDCSRKHNPQGRAAEKVKRLRHQLEMGIVQ